MALEVVALQLESAAKCVSAGSELLDAVQTFSTKMTRAVDDAIAKIDELKHSKIKLDGKIQPCFQHFRLAVENASNFVDKVDDFTYYCSREDRITKVKIAVRGSPDIAPDFGPLLELVEQLQRSLAQAEGFYKEFDEECKNSSKDSSDQAEKCKHAAIKANSKKKATRAVGGAVAAGALGGGITVSVIAGVFTFGIGTIVGLSITGATLLGSGLATSVVTGVIAKSFNDTENAFRELSRTFDSIASAAVKLHDQMQQLNTLLKAIVTVMEDIDAGREGQRVENVCAALELLLKKNTAAYTTTSRCRDSMKSIEEKVRDKMK